jgi:hypothetical protein
MQELLKAAESRHKKKHEKRLGVGKKAKNKKPFTS